MTTFNDLQTSSPKEAIDGLFEKALPLIPESTIEAIQAHYEGFIGPWESKKLINGTKAELYEKVLYNLEWTAREPGFYYFTVHVRPQTALAQIIAWADIKGASVCIWRTKDSYYLCGNKFFDYKE
jgi:hypothetical protein